jgi:hypothetical protein
MIRPAMEKGLGFIVRGQQRTGSGGWDYDYAQGKRWDLSVSSWQIQALKAGYVAETETAGVDAAMDHAVRFVRGTSFRDGRFGYSAPGQGSWGMQGAGTLALQLLGAYDVAEARAGVDSIRHGDSTHWDRKGRYSPHTNPLYAWYYEAQAVFHGGLGPWRDWYPAVQKALVDNQNDDGHWDCPGDPEHTERPEYDPYYSTTLSALTLMVWHRQLPTYQQPARVARRPTPRRDLSSGLADLDLRID